MLGLEPKCARNLSTVRDWTDFSFAQSVNKGAFGTACCLLTIELQELINNRLVYYEVLHCRKCTLFEKLDRTPDNPITRDNVMGEGGDELRD